jgi:hypothetical protein
MIPRFQPLVVSGGKAQSEMFSGLPPKADLPPDLKLLPPPTLCECRHRRLARRLVAVRRRAVLMLPKGQRPQPRRPDRRGVLPCNYGLA